MNPIENTSSSNNLIYTIELATFPPEILEMIIAKIDQANDLRNFQLVNTTFRDLILFSPNKNIGRAFQNFLKNQFPKSSNEILRNLYDKQKMSFDEANKVSLEICKEQTKNYLELIEIYSNFPSFKIALSYRYLEICENYIYPNINTDIILLDKLAKFFPINIINDFSYFTIVELKIIFQAAASFGHDSIVRNILENYSINPSVDDNYAIKKAVQRRHINVVSYLLNHPKLDLSGNHELLKNALRSKEIFKLFLGDKRFDLFANDNELFIEAVSHNSIGAVEIFLKYIDPSINDNLAIKKAASYGYLEIVKILLKDDRVYPGAEDNYALIEAFKNCRLDVVEELLNSGKVDPSARDNYLIKTAAYIKLSYLVELLSKDPRVDTRARVDPNDKILINKLDEYKRILRRTLSYRRLLHLIKD